MNANLVALLYLVSGVLFILALRGLSSPVTSRRGNLFGMVGMAIAILTTLAARAALGRARLGAGDRRPRHRRRRRGDHRPQDRDDADAPAGGGLPLAGGPCRGDGGGGRALRAGSLRHRRGRRHPRPGADRDEPGRRHRRHHLHRLRHRLRQAQRQHERQADHAAGPARHQCRPRRAAGGAHRCPRRHREPRGVLGDRDRLAGARRADHHPDRRRRHAGGGVDAELLLRLGGGGHRLHAGQHRADHHRRAGRLLRRDPVLHHVQGHEPQLHLGDPRRLRRRHLAADRPARWRPVR